MTETRFHKSEWCGWRRDCEDCLDEMVRTTRARSPLAIQCFGFTQVFEHDWRFKPPKGDES